MTIGDFKERIKMILISYLGQPNCGDGRPVISDVWMTVELLKLPHNDKKCSLYVSTICIDMLHVRYAKRARVPLWEDGGIVSTRKPGMAKAWRSMPVHVYLKDDIRGTIFLDIFTSKNYHT